MMSFGCPKALADSERILTRLRAEGYAISPDYAGVNAVMREAEKLVGHGVKELLVISQDTSACGVDIKHATVRGHRAHITELARDLGSLGA